MGTIYNAELFRKAASTGPKKFNTPGVKTNVKIKDVKVDDRFVKIAFETEDGSQYADKTVWMTSYSPFEGEADKLKFESSVMGQLIEIVDIAAPFEEVDSVQSSSLSGYALKIKDLLDKYKDTARYNIGLIYDKKGEWLEIPQGRNIIEKYVEGVNPKIDLSYYASRLVKSEAAKAAVAAATPASGRDDNMPF